MTTQFNVTRFEEYLWLIIKTNTHYRHGKVTMIVFHKRIRRRWWSVSVVLVRRHLVHKLFFSLLYRSAIMPLMITIYMYI